MEKRYTLPVAIALVVGTVIGSGVFFKAEAVLTKTGGNLSVGILAFIIMGVVMIISACTFGVVAQSHEGVEGLVGYAAASCGKTYGYYVGWFMAVIYYPSLVSVLSWLPARYFGVLMGWEDAVVGGRTMMLAGVFMVVTYTMNALAPKLAGKFAIATTIIKLIPLLLMAVVGTIVGLTRGCNKYHIIRATLDSICYQVNDVLHAMAADSGIAMKSLRVDGGASANDYLMQTMADLSDLEVKRPCCVETTALGAAYLAGLAVGYWQSTEDITRNWSVDRVFQPAISEEERAKRIKGWNKAVRCAYHWAKDEEE